MNSVGTSRHRRTLAPLRALGSILLLFAAQEASAFQSPLQPEAVREAYSLGKSRDVQKLRDFFQMYTHSFPYPSQGPFVQSVEFRTPFEQVVLRTRLMGIGYSAFDADKEYAEQTNEVIVAIRIFNTSSFYRSLWDPNAMMTFVPGEEWVKDFQFHVSQDRNIAPQKITFEATCENKPCGYDFGGPFSISGFEVQLHFDAGQFTSRKIKIDVTTPDGQTISANFQPDSLR